MGSSEGPSVKSFPDPLLAGEVTSIDSSKNVIISNHTHTKSKISKQAHTHTNTHALQTQTHMCEHAHKDKHTLREVETHTHTHTHLGLLATGFTIPVGAALTMVLSSLSVTDQTLEIWSHDYYVFQNTQCTGGPQC